MQYTGIYKCKMSMPVAVILSVGGKRFWRAVLDNEIAIFTAEMNTIQYWTCSVTQHLCALYYKQYTAEQ